ncbi:MAG: HD domain-containing protein [Phascolarctobacterium sp.]|nr:HD domain-containing protein [Phascolarctobacterium sp.]MBQ3540825.1 HD domain-containing protein [Phascolarctobacterium sp.]MBQ7020723.1 HD domain-containing protein [Phascolarctobacterium sp.]MBR2139337.1 HD domain-containing protein [Phascolarctobacterium sp.]
MIKDFKAGVKIIQPALVRVQKIGNSSNGGVFARGLLEDNSGRIPFICFEAGLVDKLRQMEGAEAFMVSGAVDINKFSNDMALQVVVQKFDNLLPEDDITNLLPKGNFNEKEYITRLQNLIKTVRNPGLRALLETIFSGAVYDKFIMNPAGMRMHHAYIGGLLQHSVDVAGIAIALAEQIGNVDKDLVVAGALLHDVGKLREISSQIGFPYTNEGRLLGHIAMSVMMVQEAAAKLKLPQARLEQLQHILLSHHGDNEKGSPVVCATKEAFIVHYADEIDAIMNQFETYDDKSPWEFNKMMQRYLLHDK